VYELYAVLIHSGSALGGHYYAYIKNMSENKWFNFNDSTVTELVSIIDLPYNYLAFT
jgi:ubiquitin carboxyl-terminal hydrolase 47